MRYVKPVRPFFHGDRTHSPDDPPIAVHERHAEVLIKQGLAVPHQPVEAEGPLPEDGRPEKAVNPAPSKASRAVAKRA